MRMKKSSFSTALVTVNKSTEYGGRRMKLLRKQYCLRNYTGVSHTTLNPQGPGVVRIHMVPPKEPWRNPSVVIVNGQDVIPINPSWAILLNALINEINPHAGQEITKEDAREIINSALEKVKKVFPLTSKNRMRKDMKLILSSLIAVAYGKEPPVEIGYIPLGEYAPFMKAPHRMDIMISAMTKDGHWHCNQKCLHCYAAGQTEAETKELTTEEWKEAIDNLREAGVPQITFTGGEPTMRDDLVELVDHAQWFVTRLNTNGIKLTKELCSQLVEASLDSIQITFYSDKAEIHNQLVGANMYHKTVEGIKNALEVGLSVSINTPLCTVNRDYVSTLKFLRDMGVTYVTCSGLIVTGNAKTDDSISTQLSRDEIYQILEDAVKFCNENHMEIAFTSPGWIEEEKIRPLGLMVPSCGACLSNMAIAPNGDVVPCQSWLSNGSLGNILYDDWDEIWNSKKCNSIRVFSGMMKGECPLRTM